MSTFQDYLVHGAALAGAGYLASKYYNCRCHFADANPKNGSRILTQAEAEYRSSVLSQVRYLVNMKLTAGSKFYEASSACYFELSCEATPKESLFIDFVGHKITSVFFNGENLTSVASSQKWWQAERLVIPMQYAKVGSNCLIIEYVNLYDHTGDGFHQFIDPADQNEYLYTNFEPFCAHRWIPCFDQPDIKARLELSVQAPESWSVFANEKLVGPALATSDGTLLHRFHITPPIATYLFALVVGPYYTVCDSYDNGRIPLSLSCRVSLKKYMDHEELFEITKQGFKFYEKFFNFPYPFTKYDQLFVAEYNMGAMENVGCVTYNEVYIFKSTPPLARRAKRADTFLHEMSHMWFGNLATCKWWDGLWLNEAFATYIANLAGSSVTKFGSIFWLNFNQIYKGRAYREDQLSTTHPVAGICTDTNTAVANFDGLTYGKGSSMLKQLVFTVGMEGFQKGIQFYFKTHQWGNTTLNDFLSALNVGAISVGRHLETTAWSASFLETAGLNTVSTVVKLNGSNVESIALEQSAPIDLDYLRPHMLKVVVYDSINNEPTLRTSAEIKLKNVKSLNSNTSLTHLEFLVGKPAPAFVFANGDDLGYIKSLLDEHSLKYAMENLHLFKDDLLRQLIWQSLWNMVRDTRMKSTDYLALIERQIALEKQPIIIGNMLETGVACFGFVPSRLQDQISLHLFEAVLKQLQVVDDELLSVTLMDNLISFARTKATASLLVGFLDSVAPMKFPLGVNQRWRIVVKASMFGIDNNEILLKHEMNKDKSDVAERFILEARTSVPNENVKKEAWARYVDEKCTLSAHQIRADMSGFHGIGQNHLTECYTDAFFGIIRQIFQKRDKTFATSFFNHLFPPNVESDYVFLSAGSLLAELGPNDDVLKRELQEQVDGLQRARSCRALVGLN